MKVSLKWLRDYVDITTSVQELTDRLTMAGLEVTGVQVIGEGWENIVVGKIIALAPHPNADRLRLVTVDLGTQRIEAVCGAPNLVVGDKVPFARLGARLRDSDTGDIIELKPAKIRGVASEGMICSERELEVSDNHEGIMVLPSEVDIGIALTEYLGDTILDLDITPNRPDCLSVIGIAREIAALSKGSKIHIPDVHYNESGNTIDSYITVEIIEPTLCPRYCASLITGIRVTPSPKWLQQRLLTHNMRPINNIVDATNYVMLEYGQPLHAFDYKNISGKQIIVRRGEQDETITSLDGIERKLGHNTLVIADKERAVAIAGIMGGLDTEVTTETTDVLIEAANFNPATIRKGNIELGLSSEASLRFKRGLSYELPLVAVKRVSQLILELAGGRAAKGVIDVYPGKQEREPVLLPSTEIKRLLGIDLSVDKIVRALELLGFSCEQPEASLQIKVNVPWWRTDVSCAADLVEEVARIIGYDNIPTTMLSSSLPMHDPISTLPLKQKLRSILVSCCFQEVLTYSLTSLEMMSKLSPELQLTNPTPVKVANPMSREHEYLRTSLRASLLSVLARNQRFQEYSINFFEIGKIFLPTEGDLPREKEMLCAVLSSAQPEVFWHDKAEPADFFVAKRIAETIFARLDLVPNYETGEDESLYPGRNVSIVIDNSIVGIIGELHPKVSQAFKLDETAYLIEIDLEKLSDIPVSPKRYQQVSRFPSVTRDIALLADEHIIYRQIHDIIRDSSLVTDVILFDIYKGEQVPAGKKSFAFRISYQSPVRTLTDGEVDEIQQQILTRLSQELGIALRG